jgi:hypothetical protein
MIGWTQVDMRLHIGLAGATLGMDASLTWTTALRTIGEEQTLVLIRAARTNARFLLLADHD